MDTAKYFQNGLAELVEIWHILLLLLLLLLLYTARQTNPITGQETLRRSAIT
jgi:hypothetical protein